MDYARILYSEILFKPASDKILQVNLNNGNHHNDDFEAPQQQLCDPNLVKLDWLQIEKVGGGLINVGNTCFLNSVLQCLTYCAPLYNFLVKVNGGHSNSCKINQFCMLCEMEKHVKRIKNSNGTSIKPLSIVQRLKYINKCFQFGRQEDAHEFLRYILDHMWKACLMNLDINTKTSKIDARIKETTVINHIFGGYHRSQVLCLTCNSRSNTFDFFMDLILDIRNAKSLEEALKKFTQPETLENENAYKCSKCRKKVTARKRFTVYKAPNVATFQLKRFDSDRIFGGKVTKFISYPEEFDLRPYMSDTTKSPIKYQLSAVLVHVGHSSNSGHYFCYVKNSNNFWYRMDDSNVTHVNQNNVLQQQAYVLFYTRKTFDQKLYPSNDILAQHMNSNKASLYTKTSANSNTTTTTIDKTPVTSTSSSHLQQAQQPQLSIVTQLKTSSKQVNGNHKITNYFSPAKSTSQPQDLEANGLANQSTEVSTKLKIPDETDPIKNENCFSAAQSSFSTWHGSRSKLDEEDNKKRKLNETTDRDKFNEELDQGKTKKIKPHSQTDHSSNLFKLNPFQRVSSNGYQQYNNSNNNNNKRGNHGFQKHNGRQYNNSDKTSKGFPQHCHSKPNNFRRHHDSHKNRFRHHGKHKSRNFNRRH